MKKGDRKKLFGLIIMFLGIIMIIIGIIFIIESEESHTGYYGGVSRASTSKEFGGDFYTTSAQYTGLAANAVADLYKVVTLAIGIFFIFIGALDISFILLFMQNIKFQQLALLKILQIGRNIQESSRNT